MSTASQGPTRRLRRFARLAFDAMFCTEGQVVPFGKECIWNVDTTVLPRRPVVLSAGVGKDISFEKELAAYCDAQILLLDPSPTGAATMSKRDNQLPGIEFLPVGLAAQDGTSSFARPENPEEGSFWVGSGSSGEPVAFPCRSIASLAAERRWSSIDLLKIDIEGFEYDVLAGLLKSRLPVRQLCVEFHHFMPGIPASKTLRALRDLRRAGFRIAFKTGRDYTLVNTAAGVRGSAAAR